MMMYVGPLDSISQYNFEILKSNIKICITETHISEENLLHLRVDFFPQNQIGGKLHPLPL